MKIKNIILSLLILIASWQLMQAGYIYAKAEVAQYLLTRAWQKTIVTGKAQKPWSWSDSQPIAQLSIAKYHIEQIILAGANGRNLAFAPGHVSTTTLPGYAGNIAIAGHRDTHFQFLQQLEVGDMIGLKTAQGTTYYQVTQLKIADENDGWLLMNNASKLTLITCYPFDSLVAGGRQRYVVIAEPVKLYTSQKIEV